MAEVEYYLGTVGPLLIDEDNPLYDDPRQMARKADLIEYTGLSTSLVVLVGVGDPPEFDADNPVTLTFTNGLLTSIT
jgi:hypothetical protein